MSADNYPCPKCEKVFVPVAGAFIEICKHACMVPPPYPNTDPKERESLREALRNLMAEGPC